MSISDLMRVTADASAAIAGTLMVSLIAFILCGHFSRGRHMVPRCNFRKIA
jgi:hypothetical protein